jgi:DNA polymerase III sliding clamp (beta) subunit (PCNA family)
VNAPGDEILRLAQGIADRKSTMPMLANVLLRTQGKNQLTMSRASSIRSATRS